MQFDKPGQIVGSLVLLDEMVPLDIEPLRRASACDEELWRYFPLQFNGAGEDFDGWFERTLSLAEAGEHMPFVVRLKDTLEVIGTTRFYDMAPLHRRLAIGSTWYKREWRGTLINSEVRLLTMAYAFENLGVNRVEFITDPKNLPSRSAMKILGAVEEGIVRSHLIYKDGRIRDSVLFSVIRAEWPLVKERLLKRLGLQHQDRGSEIGEC